MSRSPWTRLSARGATSLALALGALNAGCVERKLLVKSDPPGAAIYVDGAYLGETRAEAPVALPFAFYGTRTVEVRKPGYVPLRRNVALEPPWYQYFPLDLVTDLLWPGTIEDVHEVEVELERREAPGDPDLLIRRAERSLEHEGRRP